MTRSTRSTQSHDARRLAGASLARCAALATVLGLTALAAASPATTPVATPESRQSTPRAQRLAANTAGPTDPGTDADSGDTGNGRFTPGPSVRMAPDRPRGPAGAGPPPPTAGANPAGTATDEDIRDIRGPKVVVPAWLIPVLVAALLACAIAGYGLWRWLRRRKPPRPLLPFELALQQLDGLRSLMEPVHAREFSIAVSDIIRRYLEQRFDVTATHRTTEEFLHDLLESTHPSLIRYRPLLSEFLQQCDLVKFGGMSLSVANMESLQQSGRAFVLETAKPDEPAPGPATSPGPATATAAAHAPSPTAGDRPGRGGA